MCFGAALLYHVHTIVFAAPSPKFGACGGFVHLTRNASHTIHVIGGVQEAESAEMLQRFFKSKRQKQQRHNPEQAHSDL